MTPWLSPPRRCVLPARSASRASTTRSVFANEMASGEAPPNVSAAAFLASVAAAPDPFQPPPHPSGPLETEP